LRYFFAFAISSRHRFERPRQGGRALRRPGIRKIIPHFSGGLTTSPRVCCSKSGSPGLRFAGTLHLTIQSQLRIASTQLALKAIHVTPKARQDYGDATRCGRAETAKTRRLETKGAFSTNRNQASL